jgi:hypothetical protein
VPSRTSNSLAACIRRLEAEKTLADWLMAGMQREGASLAQIQEAISRGGGYMSRSGIRNRLLRSQNATATED